MHYWAEFEPKCASKIVIFNSVMLLYQHFSLNQPCVLTKFEKKPNPMPQNQAQRHLRRHLPRQPSPPKAVNAKILLSMTGWRFLLSLTHILASHKQVYVTIFTPFLMVLLSSTKQLSHGSSRSEKNLKPMQPHFLMQCQPNMSTLSHALMWIGLFISGSSPWKPEVRLWLAACCAQSNVFLSKSSECLRRLGCQERGGWSHSKKHRVFIILSHRSGLSNYRYHIRETKKHGEAGSMDWEAVVAEQERVREILAQFPPKDWFNLDETALFPFAVPDCGLATVHISRKKLNKFWIILAFLCNADGSQKFPIFYIGQARHPVAFNQ